MGNSQNTHQLKWRKLPAINITHFPCPVLINNEGKYIMFVADAHEDNTDKNCIILYDVENEIYPQHLKRIHPQNTQLEDHTIAYHLEQKLVYIWGGSKHKCLIIYDVSNNKWIAKVDGATSEQIADELNVKHVSMDARMIFDSHEKLHAIGGLSSNQHFIWNAALNKLKPERFQLKFQFPLSNIHSFGLISDTTNDRIIMFGGRDGSKFLDHIWFLNLSTECWSICKNLKLNVALSFFGFVFVECIQLIIIFGGYKTGFKYSDAIYFVDLIEYKCFAAAENIKCPMAGPMHALLVPYSSSNEKLNIHLFEWGIYSTTNHFCIDLLSILPLEYHQQFSAIFSVENASDAKLSLKEMMDDIEEEHKEMGDINNANGNVIKEEKMEDNSMIVDTAGNPNVVKKVSIMRAFVGRKLEFKNMEGSDNNNDSDFGESSPIPTVPMGKESIFQTYFYTIFRADIADKYLPSFVKNGFNDMEILMEFARMDANESLSVLCNDCNMNKMLARLLLRKVSQLEKENKQLHEWLENIQMTEYYESFMVKVGILTFAMLYERVQTEKEFQELIIQQMPLQSELRLIKDANLLWRKLPNNNREMANVMENGNAQVLKTNGGIVSEGYAEGEETLYM